ncbi:MAG: alcohol dehydrogenase catalytic domain-containing protein, partial [Myxococcota bacterium]
MKAAVFTELNKELEIRDDVELINMGPRDVRVKIASSGVCHSDISVQNGTIPSPAPVVLGHEGAGIVQEVGDAVSTVAVGDHVILSFIPACSVCTPCLRRQSYLCAETGPQSMAAHFQFDGKPVTGMTGLGTFAEEL